MPDDQVKIKKQSYESDGMVCCSDGDHYPYGTSLRFDKDMIEELGIDSLAVGDVVEIRAFAFVDSKSEHSNTEYSDKTVGLQLTSIKVKREEGDRAEQLYGPNS